MIQFEVEASFQYKGSGQSAYFSASSYDEVISEMKRIWYRAGLVFNRDEAFLIVHLSVDGVEQRLYIGDFVFDDELQLCGMHHINDQKPIYDVLSNLCFTFDEYEDPEYLFEKIIRFLFEKNTPEKLLGSWLIKLSLENFDFKGIEPEQAIIAHLLKFSDQQEKLFEMYHWCLSPDGEKFFDSNDSFPYAANCICDELKEITEGNFKNLSMNADEENEEDLDESENLEENTDDAPLIKEKILENLRRYISLYERPLPFELKLE